MSSFHIGEDFEAKGIEFLKSQGFSKIHWVSKEVPSLPYDLIAEKDGKSYFIEIRGRTTGESFVFKDTKIKKLKKLGEENVLLLLIEGDTCNIYPLSSLNSEPKIHITRQATNREIENLTKKVTRLEILMQKVMHILEMSKDVEVLADPFDYARDDLDKQIINELLKRKVATATEIHQKLKIKSFSRQALGKRLQRMMKESSALAVEWLEYNPKRIKQHFRAWWIISEAIKPEILKKYEAEEEESPQ